MLDSKIPEGAIKDKWTNHKSNIKLVNPANKRHIDVIVIGTGLAGSSAAASLTSLRNASLRAMISGLHCLALVCLHDFKICAMFVTHCHVPLPQWTHLQLSHKRFVTLDLGSTR